MEVRDTGLKFGMELDFLPVGEPPRVPSFRERTGAGRRQR